MKIEKVFITNKKKNFIIVRFSFDSNEDSKLILEFKKRGKTLATKLNPVLARDSSRSRNYKKVISNAIAGEVSEFCWRYWIAKIAKEQNIELRLFNTNIDERKNQIDIVIEHEDHKKKNAEVRSSFPYAGLKKAITINFDVIGWYCNEIKINEIKKDYYLRVLFPFLVNEFIEKINNSFDACLCGGATKKLLEESSYAKDKEFIPYDEINYENIKLTKYRVIEPIINGYDTDKITEIILKGNQE